MYGFYGFLMVVCLYLVIKGVKNYKNMILCKLSQYQLMLYFVFTDVSVGEKKMSMPASRAQSAIDGELNAAAGSAASLNQEKLEDAVDETEGWHIIY